MQMISWPAIWSESTSEPPVETFETIRPVRAWIRKTLQLWADDPLPPLRGVISGWVVLVGYFWTCGDAFSYAAAKWLFGWTPALGYGTGNFASYYACAFVVSASGFVLSGFVVSCWRRACRDAALLGFLLSLELAIAASVIALMAIARPVTVPHTWFYAMWLGLPFAWSNGFVLSPSLVIVGSWLGCRERARGTSSFARNKEH